MTKKLRLACTLLVIVAGGCDTQEGRGRGGRVGGGGDEDMGVSTDDGMISEPFPDGGVFDPPDGMYVVQDPVDCAEAEANKSYIGCDYWPTVTANSVWSIFDFTVVVSNPGMETAEITVTGPPPENSTTPTMVTASVPAGEVQKIYLPWVRELKGEDTNATGGAPPLTASTFKAGGAYHLVSTKPVLVYQFNALQYKGAGGPSGKDWSSCPGANGIGCFSFSNDASLLLPSTAMTGNYRIVTSRSTDGPQPLPFIPPGPGMRAFVAITATQDNTTVQMRVSSTGEIIAGTGVTATAANGTATFTMNAGDVVQLVGGDKKASDLSGSVVQADKPVQVIGGIPCLANPSNACDHMEETVLPAETWGKRYAVTMPTGPNGAPAPATVRFVGNVDGTKLTYTPAVSGAPATLNAGQVVELDQVTTDFVVVGDQAFAVSMVQKSASVVDPMSTVGKGDPSLSSAVAIEQYRLKYVFLAPDDYDISYADVVAPMGATLTLDGAPVTVSGTQLGTTGYQVVRIKLDAGKGGAHTLTSDQPAGLQISGYGSYTSYQYPGGLNLLLIAPPVPIL